MSIISKSLVAIFFVFALNSAYRTIEVFNYSNHPDDNQIITSGNYSIKLSKQGIEQFNNDINNTLFSSEYKKCKNYNNIKNTIINLTNVIKKFGDEIKTRQYSYNDKKIQEIEKIFNNILDKIMLEINAIKLVEQETKHYLQNEKYLSDNYRRFMNYNDSSSYTKDLDFLIYKAKYEIINTFTYISYLFETFIIIILLLIIIVLEYKFKDINKNK